MRVVWTIPLGASCAQRPASAYIALGASAINVLTVSLRCVTVYRYRSRRFRRGDSRIARDHNRTIIGAPVPSPLGKVASAAGRCRMRPHTKGALLYTNRAHTPRAHTPRAHTPRAHTPRAHTPRPHTSVGRGLAPAASNDIYQISPKASAGNDICPDCRCRWRDTLRRLAAAYFKFSPRQCSPKAGFHVSHFCMNCPSGSRSSLHLMPPLRRFSPSSA